MNAHVHLGESELLRVALEGAGERRGTLAGCPDCGARLAELEAFLRTCRAVARERDAEPVRAGNLAERVLALTTRADPSWRGDLRLLRGFVQGRLRSSRMLRFAAASLVAHLVALPVFAWLAFAEPPVERGFRTAIERPEPRLPDVPMEPERTPRFEDPEPEPRLIEADLWADPERLRAAAAARASERDRLVASVPPEVASEAPADPIARLLWARARILAGERPPPAEATAPPGSGAFELSIAAEAQLDRLILSGERYAELDVLLERLAGTRPASRSERSLRALALARAARAGVLRAPDAASLEELLAALDLPRSGAGAAEAWRLALGEAAAQRGPAASAAAMAWSSWGR